MNASTIATTLMATKEMMSSVSQQPMLTPDFKALGPEQSQFFAELNEIGPRLVSEAQPDDIISLHRIGVACRLCGYFELAELFYVRAFELAEQTYGLDSLETSTHRNFLAALYFVWQKLIAARALIEASVKVYESQLGQHHIHTRLAYFGLALVCVRLGAQLAGKKYYDLSALKNMEATEAQSADHWSNLTVRLSGLAAMMFEKGNYDESFELFRYCVIYEAHEAWPGSLVVARALTSLALLCRAQRLHGEAEQFFKMALQMKEEILGREHADYLQTYGQYRDLLRYLGKSVPA